MDCIKNKQENGNTDTNIINIRKEEEEIPPEQYFEMGLNEVISYFEKWEIFKNNN